MWKQVVGKICTIIIAILLCIAFANGYVLASSDVVEKILAQATQQGQEVIHNATVIPCGPSGPGQITFPDGTEYDGFSPDGVTTYYKNEADTLTIAATSEGIKYVSGKGVVKYNNKFYCFGF